MSTKGQKRGRGCDAAAVTAAAPSPSNKRKPSPRSNLPPVSSLTDIVNRLDQLKLESDQNRLQKFVEVVRGAAWLDKFKESAAKYGQYLSQQRGKAGKKAEATTSKTSGDGDIGFSWTPWSQVSPVSLEEGTAVIRTANADGHKDTRLNDPLALKIRKHFQQAAFGQVADVGSGVEKPQKGRQEKGKTNHSFGLSGHHGSSTQSLPSFRSCIDNDYIDIEDRKDVFHVCRLACHGTIKYNTSHCGEQNWLAGIMQLKCTRTLGNIQWTISMIFTDDQLLLRCKLNDNVEEVWHEHRGFRLTLRDGTKFYFKATSKYEILGNMTHVIKSIKKGQLEYGTLVNLDDTIESPEDPVSIFARNGYPYDKWTSSKLPSFSYHTLPTEPFVLPEPRGDFMCVLCKAKYSSVINLTLHIQRAHPFSNMLYQCLKLPTCVARFKDEASLKQHINLVHAKKTKKQNSDKSYQCPLCRERTFFNTLYDCQTHLCKVHDENVKAHSYDDLVVRD